MSAGLGRQAKPLHLDLSFWIGFHVAHHRGKRSSAATVVSWATDAGQRVLNSDLGESSSSTSRDTDPRDGWERPNERWIRTTSKTPR
jgi:hypothetical protein